MSTFKLNVRIATKDLEYLTERGFNFCLARSVKYRGTVQQGNVVFLGVRADRLAANLALQWRDNLQVFGAKEFISGALVSIQTNVEGIEEGQQATIDSNNRIQVTGNAQPGKAISFVNEWESLVNFGVSAIVADGDNYNSFFVSPPVPIRTLPAEFLPSKTCSVFWDMNMITGSMFDHTATTPFLFEVPDTNEVTIQFVDGAWFVVN